LPALIHASFGARTKPETIAPSPNFYDALDQVRWQCLRG
jgi:hypothetical protein